MNERATNILSLIEDLESYPADNEFTNKIHDWLMTLTDEQLVSVMEISILHCAVYVAGYQGKTFPSPELGYEALYRISKAIKTSIDNSIAADRESDER